MGLIFLSFPSNALAIVDPLVVANNRFGIHINSEHDFINAANLVNSTGGDWGYVTFVITQGERDLGRWQTAFDQARLLHLIPIVRIATIPEEHTWTIPEEGEIERWVEFLSSLNWVIKNRYVVIGNEPNHSLEWGGKLDPEGYAKYLAEFSQKLKGASNDFFVLPAGLDASAGNTKTTMAEKKYIDLMLKAVPNLYDYTDGWTSHSYPTSGTDTFKKEIEFLRSKGITRELPVFITETGWTLNPKGTNEHQISQDYKDAFSQIWKEDEVVAVTPFILNYPDPPFDKFSWTKADGSFYSCYEAVRSFPKSKGEPIQEVSGKIIAVFMPTFDFTDSEIKGAILARNTGQSIWNSKDITLSASGNGFKIISQIFDDIEPQRLGFITFKGLTPALLGPYKIYFGLTFKGVTITDIYLTWLTNLLK